MSSTTATQFQSHLPPKDHLTEDTTSSNLTQKAILNLLNTKCNTSLQHLRQAHAIIIRTDLSQDNYVAGTLVKCYSNPYFKSLDCAVNVFYQVQKPNAFSWNFLIKGCVENNEPLKAISFYYNMVVSDSRPNKFTYPTLFKACANAQAIQEGVQVLAHVVKLGFSEDGHIRSAGIQMHAMFGHIIEARRMLDESCESDVVCWNAMIDGYLRCGDVEAARELFERIPDRNVSTWNTMISGFARCGKIEAARDYFRNMPLRDDISWSAIIDGYIKEGCFKEALEIFHEMQRQEKIRPKKFILSSALAACANIGALDQGKWIHAYVRRNSIQIDAVLGTSLVDMYAKCGRLDMAWEVFEKMKQREAFTWNAMIGGLALHGRAEDAIELFCEMLQKAKFKPNETTFAAVLKACAHSGLVEKGLNLFQSMREVYGIEPTVEHYGCVVDLLGRAGLLAEAEELINSMPMEANAAIWGALLGACRIHGNLELGEKVGKVLLEMEPENSCRYALLSNIYAKAGKWDDVGKVRKLMKEREIQTTPGSSMIELGGTVYEFKIGKGSSNLKMKESYLMLERILERLLMVGYSPNTSQVLFDIDEKEKETTLWHHSEKLAIAFGLLNTTPGTTIRVVKNLRVCEDCHTATKLISLVYGRDIIVRDRVRYHHFRNGMCSCKDYW